MDTEKKQMETPFTWPPDKPSLFCSFDVEADGPNPLCFNMRSIGLAMFNEQGEILDKFSCHILPQRNLLGNDYPPCPQTMNKFWNRYPELWKKIQENAVTPHEAMKRLAEWLQPWFQKYTVQFVASPSCFDWMWLKCYYDKYGPSHKPELGFYCHDLSALMRAYTLMKGIRDKVGFKKELSENFPYTHEALDDAICQGKMYVNLRKLLSSNENNKMIN